MTTTQQVVVAVFTERSLAEQAINDLLGAGFRNDQIRFGGQGASGGGILHTLKSIFTGGGTSGDLHDDLLDMGVPEEDAHYYEQEYQAGRSVVAVLPEERMQEATAILARYGGYGANRRFTQTAEAASSAPGYAQRTDYDYAPAEGEQQVKLREEQLRVQKQPVETGEARLRKDVVTEQQSMDVPVSREEVYVERRPGSGQPADQPIGEGETYRVPVREEQVTVEKQPVEREEVKLGKRQVQDSQQVSDTVRREEAHIERQGDINVEGTDNVSDQPDQTTP